MGPRDPLDESRDDSLASARGAPLGDGAGDAGPPTPTPTPALRRVVSLPWLVLYGLGSTVGAGIYVLTGVVAGRAGRLAPLAFLLAAAIAMLTAATFAALAARFPRAGGALVYVREGLRSRHLSVLVGLLAAAAGAISAATVSLGFVGYFAQLIELPFGLVLAVVVASVGGLAAWGVRESVIAAGLVTAIEVAGLLAVLAFGVAHLLMEGPVALVGGALAASPPGGTSQVGPIGAALGPGAMMAVLSSTVLCFYAYLGFEDMVNVAEEVRDVRRAMPRAIRWTLVLATALYVSVALVSTLVVPPSELATHEAPLSLVFERSGGPPALLSLIALLAMLNGALVQVIMASRILFSLARDGPLPGFLGRVHPGRRTPIAATALVTLLIALLGAALPLESLAAATASVALGVFALVHLSLAALLHREAAGEGSLPIAVPVLGAITSLGLLALEIAGRLA